jgi:hypothetical protein
MDINAWLEEATKRANIPAEDRKILEGLVSKNAGLATYLEESGLRQSDYDRKMNKLKEEHQQRLEEVAEKEAAADRFAAQNGEWFNQNNSKFTKATQELEAARVEKAKLEERMRGLATRYGVPDEELNIPVSAAPATPPAAAAPAFDEKRFVPREEADRFARDLPLVTAELHELAEEHRELFGKPLRGSKELIQKAMKQNKTMRAVWEEENKVAERREAMKEQAIQSRVDSAVQERETKIRSELQLPAPRPQEQHSPIVQKFAKATVDPKVDPGRGLRAALGAYASGKYRDDGGRAA